MWGDGLERDEVDKGIEVDNNEDGSGGDELVFKKDLISVIEG